MSKIDKKSKFLELEGVRVTYRPKDDTIHVTSKDQDLQGEGFNLTLKNGTPSEDALRKLLIKKGLIKTELLSQQAFPKIAPYVFSTDTSNEAWSKIPVGVTSDGSPYVWDIGRNSHLLLGGATGGGKSVLQRSIFNHCVAHSNKWRFIGIDLKGVELKPYAKYTKTVLSIGTTLQSAIESIRITKSIMENRYTLMEKAGVNYFTGLVDPSTGSPYPAIMLMIDEAYLLLNLEGNKDEDGIARDQMHIEAAFLLNSIAQLGRAAGVHMAIATYRPDATIMKSDFKNNLTLRIAMGRMTSTPSYMILDNEKATTIPNHVGRGYAISNGDASDFQAYYAAYDVLDEHIIRNPLLDPKRYAQLVSSPNYSE